MGRLVAESSVAELRGASSVLLRAEPRALAADVVARVVGPAPLQIEPDGALRVGVDADRCAAIATALVEAGGRGPQAPPRRAHAGGGRLRDDRRHDDPGGGGGMIASVRAEPAAAVAGDDDRLAQALPADMSPAELPATLVAGMPLFGGAIVLILGALATGDGYALGTWKTVPTQAP